MNKNTLLFGILAIILIAVLAGALYKSKTSPVTGASIKGDPRILNEITRLLLPVDARNITAGDFIPLKTMVENDEYATDEVTELQTLAKYKEYAHIGHGLGSLYDYVKTGEESICPGHNLAHYYVFIAHGETEFAEENLDEAREGSTTWRSLQSAEPEQSDALLTLFTETLRKIDAGNTQATEEEISELADAPCI